MMQNIEVAERDGKLVITVDLSIDLGPSDSGKSIIVAKTGGWHPVGREIEDGKLALNLGLIRKPHGAWRETKGVA